MERIRFVMKSVILSVLCLIASVTSAALEVTVVDTSGRPVENAVVWVPGAGDFSSDQESAVMDQINREFVPHVLSISKGASVRFPNSDSIYHQVYSFSPVRAFQLPLYRGQDAEPVDFPREGVVSIGCNIHDQMSAYIVVVDSSIHGVTDEAGKVMLEVDSEESYTIRVIVPDFSKEGEVAVAGEKLKVRVEVR